MFQIDSQTFVSWGCLYNDSNELDNWPWRLEMRLHMQLEGANVIIDASIRKLTAIKLTHPPIVQEYL
jgi:hypothetical protein